jgi:hypothetical protein
MFWHRYSLCTIKKCGTIQLDFPKTIKEYQENIGYWQQWHGGMGYREKIVSLIPHGTHYRILDRHSGTFNQILMKPLFCWMALYLK